MRRAEQAGIGALVLAAHALLLWLWPNTLSPPRTPLPTRTVTLLPITPPRPLTAATVPTAPSNAPAAAPRTEVARPNPKPPPAAVPITAESASREPDAPHTETAVAPPPANAASRPTLDTTLPRAATAPAERSMRDRMLNDPRSNSPPPTLEGRVAGVAGTPEWTEERMDATRT